MVLFAETERTCTGVLERPLQTVPSRSRSLLDAGDSWDENVFTLGTRGPVGFTSFSKLQASSVLGRFNFADFPVTGYC
jgi:hypothetical protein